MLHLALFYEPIELYLVVNFHNNIRHNAPFYPACSKSYSSLKSADYSGIPYINSDFWTIGHSNIDGNQSFLYVSYFSLLIYVVCIQTIFWFKIQVIIPFFYFLDKGMVPMGLTVWDVKHPPVGLKKQSTSRRRSQSNQQTRDISLVVFGRYLATKYYD
jgi:hypothetical protein